MRHIPEKADRLPVQIISGQNILQFDKLHSWTEPVDLARQSIPSLAAALMAGHVQHHHSARANLPERDTGYAPARKPNGVDDPECSKHVTCDAAHMAIVPVLTAMSPKVLVPNTHPVSS